MIAWDDFLISMVSTFVGFLLAILGERLYDYYKDKKEGNQLVEAFSKELQNILTLIEEISKNEGLTWVNPIKVPVWESTICTNTLSLLSSYDWYGDLLSLYDEIKDYNEWHELRTKQYYSGGKIGSISDALTTSENEIKNKATSLIQKMEE